MNSPPALALLLPGNVWSNLALFAMPAMAITVPSGSAYPAALLILAGCVSLMHKSGRGPLPASARGMYLSFVPLALCWLLDAILSNMGASGLEMPAKVLATLPALFYLTRKPPSHYWLWIGVGAGCLLACAEAAYQVFILHMARAEGGMFSIHFGDLAVMFGLMSLCAWNLPTQRPVLLRCCLLLVCLAGLLASALSGTRGAWLTLGLVALAYLGYLVMQGRYKPFFSIVVALSVLALFAYFGPKSLGIQGRIQQATAQYHAYTEASQANSSVGARLQIWKQAIRLYREKPLLGWQHHGYLEQQRAGIRENVLSPRLAEYDHPHNEVLNAAAKQGTVGVLALLLAYGGPLLLFAHWFRSADPAHNRALRAVCAAGMLVVIAHAGFGLTETYLPHNSPLTIYFYLLVLLWGTAWGLQQSRPDQSASHPQH
ncbi:MAG: O-antigen ligase family protein [Brachymonas denitrificans]|uniref:O-antigen ligase family protein n=1 Tax=Brachymonas denitrificans TaxID=28220 RepID=UPI00352C1355